MTCRRGATSLPLVAALAWLGATAGAVARADARDLAAPLGVTTPGPVRQLFLDPILTDARAVTRPCFQLRLEVANSWSVPARFSRGFDVMYVQTDAEADTLVLNVAIPWSSIGGETPVADWRRRFATTIGWRGTVYWGGFTDGVIETWHHVISSTNFLRQKYPSGEVHLQMVDASGAGPFDLHSSELAWGDLVIGTQALLASGGSSSVSEARPGEESWGVSARIDLKLPLGSLSRVGGSGGFDAAVSLLGTVEVAPWLVLHGRTSASLVSPMAARSAMQPNTLQLGAEASAVILLGRWAIVLEDRYLSALMDGTGWTVDDHGINDVFVSSSYDALFRAHNQITVGIRRGNVTFSVSEDFTPGSNPRGGQKWFYDSNAPDVVFALTLRMP